MQNLEIIERIKLNQLTNENQLSDIRAAKLLGHHHDGDETTIGSVLADGETYNFQLVGNITLVPGAGYGNSSIIKNPDDIPDEAIEAIENQQPISIEGQQYIIDGSPWFEWVDEDGDSVGDILEASSTNFEDEVQRLLEALNKPSLGNGLKSNKLKVMAALNNAEMLKESKESEIIVDLIQSSEMVEFLYNSTMDMDNEAEIAQTEALAAKIESCIHNKKPNLDDLSDSDLKSLDQRFSDSYVNPERQIGGQSIDSGAMGLLSDVKGRLNSLKEMRKGTPNAPTQKV